MYKIGVVYKGSPETDISALSFRKKLSVLFNHLIDNSSILNSNIDLGAILEENNKPNRIEQYKKSILFNLTEFYKVNRTDKEFSFKVPNKDLDLVTTALQASVFDEYDVTNKKLNHNLQELKAIDYTIYVMKKRGV